MPRNSALRFKSGKGKSVRSDKIRAQKKRTFKSNFKHFKTICLTFSIFILSLAFLTGFIIHKKLNENFVSADSYSSYSSDYLSFSYIVVDDFEANPIHLEKLNFVILDKNANKVLIFNVPLDLEVNLPGRYADMPINKIFALGGLNSEDKLKGGIDLLNTTLFKIFGFAVGDYVLVEDPLSHNVDRLVYEGKSIFPFGGMSISDMKSAFDTSLSLKSFYQIQKFLGTLPADRFIRATISALQVSNPAFLDDMFEDMTLSSNIALEKKTVSVLNGTNLSGIAALGSRVIKNMGGRVVSIENATDQYSNTVLITDDLDSQTVAYIKKAFNIDRVYTKSDAPFVKESAISRSDITLILGFDLATRVY